MSWGDDEMWRRREQEFPASTRRPSSARRLWLAATPSRAQRREWRNLLQGAAAAAAVLLLGAFTFRGAIAHAPVAQRDPEGSRSSYRFMQHQPGQPSVPVTYSPCRPIHIVVNDDLAPVGSYQLMDQAIDEIHRATGLDFVVDGHSSATPSFTGQPWNLVDRPPVLIGWTTSSRVPGLVGNLGLGGSSTASAATNGQRFYVTGQIALNAPELTKLMARGDDYFVLGTIAHELGHVVGLNHVHDRHELMSEHSDTRGRLGPGDRVGLRKVGRGPCYA